MSTVILDSWQYVAVQILSMFCFQIPCLSVKNSDEFELNSITRAQLSSALKRPWYSGYPGMVMATDKSSAMVLLFYWQVTLVTLGHVSALCCIYWRQLIQPHYSNHSQPLPSGSVNKQPADSRVPGGKQIQDTGDLFFISTSLTSYALQVLFRSLQIWTPTPPRQIIVVLFQVLTASSRCH